MPVQDQNRKPETELNPEAETELDFDKGIEQDIRTLDRALDLRLKFTPIDNPRKIVLRLKATRKKYLSQKHVGGCIYKVKEVYSPYMEVFRGFRILVATPNMDGRIPFKDVPAPSFMRPYLIFQTSDYTEQDVGKAEELLVADLRLRGFIRVEDVESYQTRMLLRMGIRPSE